MADNAPPPQDEGDHQAPKAGMMMPPVLELVTSLTATLDGGQATASWKVAGKDGDNGDFEYFAVARAPDIDLASNMNGQKPLAVTLKPDLHVVATQINAIGGAPLAGTQVQLIDPETHLPVGEPAVTNEQGQVILHAEENKPHQIEIIDHDHDDTPPAETENAVAGEPHGPTLSVRLLTPTGEPKAGIEVEVKPLATRTAPRKVTTSAEGELHLNGVAAGAYEISAEGKKAVAHTLSEGDIELNPEPYKAVLK